LRPLGFSRETRMAPSVARESTLHCKLDSPLHWAAVRSTFWVGGKWIMEIPVESTTGRRKPRGRSRGDGKLCEKSRKKQVEMPVGCIRKASRPLLCGPLVSDSKIAVGNEPA
jgi:hypothetical protein